MKVVPLEPLEHLHHSGSSYQSHSCLHNSPFQSIFAPDTTPLLFKCYLLLHYLLQFCHFYPLQLSRAAITRKENQEKRDTHNLFTPLSHFFRSELCYKKRVQCIVKIGSCWSEVKRQVLRQELRFAGKRPQSWQRRSSGSRST